MADPFLSVIVPVLNEEACIASFIDRMRAELSRLVPSWEIVVIDDGSTDRTREIVEAHAEQDARVRLVLMDHRGKGAAVRRGLLEARGTWRFMADADLAMPPDNLPRFLDAARGEAPPSLAIGSREAPGARRIDEPWPRHAIGRVFNWYVRCLALPGIQDTQCGFKLLHARAVEQIVPRMTVDGFAFDVEMLLLARRAGLSLREVGITWIARPGTRVALGRGAAAFLDILRIRWRWANRFTLWAYLLAAVVGGAIAHDLLRMPVQVYDSLGEIIDAHGSPSVAASFQNALGSAGYLRPLRVAQIKWLHDIAGGHDWAVYRGFHAVLLMATVFLFTRVLRIRSGTDLAALALALTVLTGHHAFLGTVQEAFPINHFLEIVLGCLVALNLSRARPRWSVDIAACLTFVLAALTLESGLLVWVTLAAAWLCGLRGVSLRGLGGVTALLAAYFVVRFVVYPTGTPALGERATGYLFEMLERTDIDAKFGANPWRFYAYNVAASLGSVLFGEPQRGLFVRPERWLEGTAAPRNYLAVVSCTLTTVAIAWMASRSIGRRWREADVADRLLPVAGAVVAANAVFCFAYTKDDVMSVAAAFYAIAAYVTARRLIEALVRAKSRVLVAMTIVPLLAVCIAWSIRSAGVHHVLRSQAFRQRNDWAVLPSRMRREGTWPASSGVEGPGDARRDLILDLRHDALQMDVPNSSLFARWANDWWGE